MSKTVALRPRLNEKTYALATSRVYVFDVVGSANKHTIARAVESQFDVKVVEVNTVNVKGKAKRIVSITGKRMVNANGQRPDFKKAYVTLAEGNSLPFFDAVEEAEAKDQDLQEKLDKAAEKEAKKAEKPARRGLRRKKDEESK
jgi:large subunit ribosomal protein L23